MSIYNTSVGNSRRLNRIVKPIHNTSGLKKMPVNDSKRSSYGGITITCDTHKMPLTPEQAAMELLNIPITHSRKSSHVGITIISDEEKASVSQSRRSSPVSEIIIRDADKITTNQLPEDRVVSVQALYVMQQKCH
jgi:hypothetical protein